MSAIFVETNGGSGLIHAARSGASTERPTSEIKWIDFISLVAAPTNSENLSVCIGRCLS